MSPISPYFSKSGFKSSVLVRYEILSTLRLTMLLVLGIRDMATAESRIVLLSHVIFACFTF